MKIAIIGGSIAGCISAIELAKLGHEIHIYERAKEAFHSRGTGIGIPTELIQELIERDDVDVDIKRVKIDKRQIYVRDNSVDPYYGREIYQEPFNMSTLNWGELYHQLHKRVPKEWMHLGISISNIKSHDKVVEIEVDGKMIQFDMLVGCDGYQSTVRRLIAEEVDPNFADYVVWRGLSELQKKEQNIFISNKFWFYFNAFGHLVIYPVYQFSHQENSELLVNWSLNEVIDEERLDLYTKDKNGKLVNTIPPELMSSKQKHHIIKFAEDNLPTVACEIIKQAKQPSMHAVMDLCVDKYVKNRMCIIGDASTMLRAHTASGATKALQDTLSLVKLLSKHDNINEALSIWEKEIAGKNKVLFELGKVLGEFMVTHPPDWRQMNKEEFELRWNKLISQYNWYPVSQKRTL